MSDSLSSADRDARIAEIALRLRKIVARKVAKSRAQNYEATMVTVNIADLEAVIAELRAALSREEEARANYQVLLEAATRDAMELGEAKKDAERYREVRLAFVDVKWADMPINLEVHAPLEGDGEREKYVTLEGFDAVIDECVLIENAARALSHSRRTAE